MHKILLRMGFIIILSLVASCHWNNESEKKEAVNENGDDEIVLAEDNNDGRSGNLSSDNKRLFLLPHEVMINGLGIDPNTQRTVDWRTAYDYFSDDIENKARLAQLLGRSAKSRQTTIHQLNTELNISVGHNEFESVQIVVDLSKHQMPLNGNIITISLNSELAHLGPQLFLSKDVPIRLPYYMMEKDPDYYTPGQFYGKYHQTPYPRVGLRVPDNLIPIASEANGEFIINLESLGINIPEKLDLGSSRSYKQNEYPVLILWLRLWIGSDVSNGIHDGLINASFGIDDESSEESAHILIDVNPVDVAMKLSQTIEPSIVTGIVSDNFQWFGMKVPPYDPPLFAQQELFNSEDTGKAFEIQAEALMRYGLTPTFQYAMSSHFADYFPGKFILRRAFPFGDTWASETLLLTDTPKASAFYMSTENTDLDAVTLTSRSNESSWVFEKFLKKGDVVGVSFDLELVGFEETMCTQVKNGSDWSESIFNNILQIQIYDQQTGKEGGNLNLTCYWLRLMNGYFGDADKNKSPYVWSDGLSVKQKVIDGVSRKILKGRIYLSTLECGKNADPKFAFCNDAAKFLASIGDDIGLRFKVVYKEDRNVPVWNWHDRVELNVSNVIVQEEGYSHDCSNNTCSDESLGKAQIVPRKFSAGEWSPEPFSSSDGKFRNYIVREAPIDIDWESQVVRRYVDHLLVDGVIEPGGGKKKYPSFFEFPLPYTFTYWLKHADDAVYGAYKPWHSNPNGKHYESATVVANWYDNSSVSSVPMIPARTEGELNARGAIVEKGKSFDRIRAEYMAGLESYFKALAYGAQQRKYHNGTTVLYVDLKDEPEKIPVCGYVVQDLFGGNWNDPNFDKLNEFFGSFIRPNGGNAEICIFGEKDQTSEQPNYKSFTTRTILDDRYQEPTIIADSSFSYGFPSASLFQRSYKLIQKYFPKGTNRELRSMISGVAGNEIRPIHYLTLDNPNYRISDF